MAGQRSRRNGAGAPERCPGAGSRSAQLVRLNWVNSQYDSAPSRAASTLDRTADRPIDVERIAQRSVAIAPELIFQRHPYLAPCGNRAIPPGVGIVDLQVDGEAAHV